MPENNKTCSECGGEMTVGFILDRTQGGVLVPRWVKGEPEMSAWTGVKAKGKECRTVETFRCVKCGFLKSYATTEVGPPTWVNP